ncbi:MAG: hypothetical protein KatS3mg131_3469 [Candidatus Tectimicrobiota bacterium]|nr:MAG: hypothetical protein KatS3mg131_3469 [Candidatus Tectomicrobia bacterium]
MRPHHHQAAVEAQAQVQRQPLLRLELGAQGRHFLLDAQRRQHRSQRVVLQRQGGPEEGHQAIAQKLVDGPLVVVHGSSRQPQHLVHEPVHGLGIEALGQRRGVDHVAEEDGDFLALALKGAAGGEDLLSEVRRRVGTGRGRLWRQRLAAVNAEAIRRGIGPLAARASAGQRGAAGRAEGRLSRRWGMALGTLHGRASCRWPPATASRWRA